MFVDVYVCDRIVLITFFTKTSITTLFILIYADNLRVSILHNNEIYNEKKWWEMKNTTMQHNEIERINESDENYDTMENEEEPNIWNKTQFTK